ncbi:transcription factor [Ganoderma sinense ZZ0214-1]|uniref:Transcription factor n=1 Tax=Ganoderma sinense ZZ0214-1 TaxID=1077348 RepID=A0A2G8STB6_9APHY|nr:transcription factor [Ganoderma sinense ZZ0214-1]
MQPQLNRLNTASPFTPPTPTPSPGAVSMTASDSDWSTASDWSLDSSNPSSRAQSPYLLASRSIPQNSSAITEEHIKTLLEVYQAMGGRATPIPTTSQCPPPAPALTPPFGVSLDGAKRKIPRPANAFMLYRSWLLKSGQIPPNIEKRQQHISRVAGECWNLLSKEDQQTWHDKAEEVKREHGKKYPEWKFAPERKSSRRKTPSDPDAPVPEGEEYIRWIRETYVGLKGDAVAPPRPRKSKSRRTASARSSGKAKVEDEPVPALSYTPAPSPASTLVMLQTPSLSVPASPAVSFSCPLSTPANVVDYRLPLLTSPAPLAHELASDAMLGTFVESLALQNANDDDATPRASTFGNIVLPTPPKYTFPELFPSSSMQASPSLSDPLAAATASSTREPTGPAPVVEAQGNWLSSLSEDPNMYFSFSDYPSHMDFEGTIFPDLRPQ